MNLSVIICTHNPRPDYLARVLVALRQQTLPSSNWELLLIDNASTSALADNWDLSWHPDSRHIREDELGLTPARARGIKESRGKLLVFVDDDNVLAADYLEEALRISAEWPKLATWGGSIAGEFESPPPAWAVPYLRRLAIREIKNARWSNVISDQEALPFGAGMCVRREIANEYVSTMPNNVLGQILDRQGSNLTSGGDDDLSFLARQLGLGTGIFPSLRLQHLIPVTRISEEYLVRLVEGMHFSGTILHYKISGVRPEFSLSKAIKFLYHVLRRSRRDRRFYIASQRGELRARNFIKSHNIVTVK